ncbi:MAG: lytic transglycosylase domain-containing protein [Desulfovibrionaceae bacterium]|nr:lytic transglycosylase domain-containing protein [Desulfovibrionaceae bacterium]
MLPSGVKYTIFPLPFALTASFMLVGLCPALPASQAAAPSANAAASRAPKPEGVTIYRRVDEDGTITLTNRPDGDTRFAPLGHFSAVKILQSVGSQGMQSLAEKYGAVHGLDPRLIEAVIQVESGFEPRAVSPAGAGGLMQIMPETGKALGIQDRFDPDANVEGGTRYLKSMLQRFGSLPLALAAYNAGPGNVEKYKGIPPFAETQNYVQKVLTLYGNSTSQGK